MMMFINIRIIEYITRYKAENTKAGGLATQATVAGGNETTAKVESPLKQGE